MNCGIEQALNGQNIGWFNLVIRLEELCFWFCVLEQAYKFESGKESALDVERERAVDGPLGDSERADMVANLATPGVVRESSNSFSERGMLRLSAMGAKSLSRDAGKVKIQDPGICSKPEDPNYRENDVPARTGIVEWKVKILDRLALAASKTDVSKEHCQAAHAPFSRQRTTSVTRTEAHDAIQKEIRALVGVPVVSGNVVNEGAGFGVSALVQGSSGRWFFRDDFVIFVIIVVNFVVIFDVIFVHGNLVHGVFLSEVFNGII